MKLNERLFVTTQIGNMRKPTSRYRHRDRLPFFGLARPSAQCTRCGDNGSAPTATATCAFHQERTRVHRFL